MTMLYDDTGTSGVRRFEVFTGAGRRRDWAPEVKAAIIAESYSGVETVCAVARRHGLAPSQLFTWRRHLRKAVEARELVPPTIPEPAFVPAVIALEPPGDTVPVSRKRLRRRRRSQAGSVELEIDGVAVKIGRDADAGVIAAVIEALKATR